MGKYGLAEIFVVPPEEAGTGQVPAKAANAASERTLPVCNQAVRMIAANARACTWLPVG